MIVMGQNSFREYIKSFTKNRTNAFSWPLFFLHTPSYQVNVLKEPKKYINWLVWVLVTAPPPKSKEEQETKIAIENCIAEILSIEDENDVIAAIEKNIYES